MKFMPESAPLVILTFLGTCFALGATGLVIDRVFVALASRRRFAWFRRPGQFEIASGTLALHRISPSRP